VKVVLFCGGFGLRMREESTRLPKPMIPLGDRPILWHIMKYYSDFGCREFVLCLGYKAEVIKEYFLNYNEALSNDFVLRDGGRQIELLGSRDTHDWSITFVDTGLTSSIGERLRRVRPHVESDDIFLATYGDGLTDAPLNDLIGTLGENDKAALFLCVKPTFQFHIAALEGGKIRELRDVAKADLWIDGGYFVLRQDVFDYLHEGGDLVDALNRMIVDDKVIAYQYDGFWAPMDTLKDKQMLETLLESGDAPWQHPRGLDAERSGMKS
jgi:glucose-1-phosphate cytidylyltransferase